MVKAIIKFSSGFALAFFLLSVLVISIFKYYNPTFSSFMQIKSPTPFISSSTCNSFSYTWINIDKVSPNFLLAVIATEDQKYPNHYGFDIDQISKAVDEKVKGIRIRGASTITQQTTKNMFLWGGKDYIRKAFEAYYSLIIELVWGKQRILEVYVNIAEMGENIYGIESAASFYFNKSAKNITKSEAAMLAAILPNPLKFNPKYPDTYLLERRNQILIQMENLGGIEFLETILNK